MESYNSHKRDPIGNKKYKKQKVQKINKIKPTESQWPVDRSPVHTPQKRSLEHFSPYDSSSIASKCEANYHHWSGLTTCSGQNARLEWRKYSYLRDFKSQCKETS